jgi:anti-anti-sigma factor
MSESSARQAHISYELIDDAEPRVVVIEFLSHAIGTPAQAHELGEQLHSLIRPELPNQFVLDFRNVRNVGSTAFGAIVSFVRDVRKSGGRIKVCGFNEIVKLGATLIGLDEMAEFADDRQSAIDEYLKPAAPTNEVMFLA